MTRKNLNGKKKASKGDVGNVLKLDNETRLNLCRFEAEVRAARNQFTLEQMRLGEYIKSIDKDGIIAKSQATLQATALHMATMEARYNSLRQEVEEKLGIALREYSFDDETGTLHKHPVANGSAGVEMAPARAKN